LGRRHRFYVTPITYMERPGREQFDDPNWSLLVFQESAVSEGINLSTVWLAVVLFACYALGATAVWGLLHWTSPALVTKWFWPDPRKGSRYDIVAFVNATAGITFLGAVWASGSLRLLAGAMILAACATAATFAVVRAKPDDRPAPPDWLAAFFRARASLLFVGAIVPAIVCYQVAFVFHTTP